MTRAERVEAEWLALYREWGAGESDAEIVNLARTSREWQVADATDHLTAVLWTLAERVAGPPLRWLTKLVKGAHDAA